MKNKAFPLPSINSSPAINTFVSAGDSYYLHAQTLRVPGREGSHRLWLHQTCLFTTAFRFEKDLLVLFE